MTAVAAVPVGIAAAFALQAPAAQAAPAASSHQAAIAKLASASRAQLMANRRHRYRYSHRMRAYRWAARQKGHPYVYGGTGPGFDCSGLVMEAYRHAGIRLPRTTSGMLASRKLVRVIHPRMGDLAFYGTGHVELFRRWGYTFGAHDSGTRVGLIHYGYGWRPTAFYRVR
ncbi:MAG TPA: NlpC/P60 family protein [Streptosporangiaceae bacterium]